MTFPQSLELEGAKTLLLRIYVGKNRELIPQGLPKRRQRSYEEKKRQLEAKEIVLATSMEGKRVINLRFVRALLLEELKACGLKLIEAGWVCRNEKINPKKYFIELAFSKEGDELSLSHPTMNALKGLIAKTWDFCEAYKNPTSIHVVNLRGCVPHAKVKHQVEIKDKSVVVSAIA